MLASGGECIRGRASDNRRKGGLRWGDFLSGLRRNSKKLQDLSLGASSAIGIGDGCWYVLALEAVLMMMIPVHIAKYVQDGAL